MGFPGGTSGKKSACQYRKRRTLKFDPWVRKIPWRRNGNPLQYSCLENTMDREAWWAIVHGVTKTNTTELVHTIFSEMAANIKLREKDYGQGWSKNMEVQTLG